jgi:hypothetical protein
MPINPVMNGGPQAPLEGDTDSGFTGFRFATRAAADRNLGYTAISKVQGRTRGRAYGLAEGCDHRAEERELRR